MKYLNLTPGFNPKGASEEDIISWESFTFKGGEPHIKIGYDHDLLTRELDIAGMFNVIITSRVESSEELIRVLLAKDALERTYPVDEIYLFIPYFPGARQDRDNGLGEPLTVKVFADLINNACFEAVEIFDAHSDVTPALIDRIYAADNHSFVHEALLHYIENHDFLVNEVIDEKDDAVNYNNTIRRGNLIIISPDSGSNKKINKLCADLLHYTETENALPPNLQIVKCDKERDVATGKLSGFTVYADDLEGKTCFIVDDICDGGGTFLGLAKKLKEKNAGDLVLIVSHGIFSNGLLELDKVFDEVYTTDSFSLDKHRNEMDALGKLNIILLKDA